MSFWDFMGSSTPAGVASSAAEGLATGILGGIDKIIRDFKLPPEQMVVFESRMAELQAQTAQKLEELAVSDRNSARQREMTVRDNMPKILAVMFVVGFFGVLASMMVYGAPAGAGGEAFILILGTLTSGVGLVLGYYFGSSSSSAYKNKVLGEMVHK